MPIIVEYNKSGKVFVVNETEKAFKRNEKERLKYSLRLTDKDIANECCISNYGSHVHYVANVKGKSNVKAK